MTDHALTDALAATIQTTRSAERDLFGGLDPAILERPIRKGDWTPKDFQAHLTAWKARQADRYAAVREGREIPPPLAEEEEESLNDELRAAREEWSWEAVFEEADSVAERLVGEIRKADENVLRVSDRLLPGTFGNGVLHALTHFRWLREAGVPLDTAREASFADETRRLVGAEPIPGPARAIGYYDLACYHALSDDPATARDLLREAFRLDPELVAFSHTDEDLVSLKDELDRLAGD